MVKIASTSKTSSVKSFLDFTVTSGGSNATRIYNEKKRTNPCELYRCSDGSHIVRVYF